MILIPGTRGLKELLKTTLGPSAWYVVTQKTINEFATITNDHHWVHVDVDRAKHSPIGTTIAHGLFTLSLEPKFSNELYEITDISYSLDYGYRKIRFPSPVPVGSRIRMSALIEEVTDIPNGSRCIVVNTFELEGSHKPACVAELILHIVDK